MQRSSEELSISSETIGSRLAVPRSHRSIKSSTFETPFSSQEVSNCIIFQRNFCKKYNISIDLNGRIYKILNPNLYKGNLLKLCGLIMVGFFARIIRRFPFYPVTVVGNTVYSQVVAAALDQSNIKYALCKSNHRITYYETDQGDEIPFEGSSPNQFPSKIVSLIPLSTDELTRLETHTRLSNLDQIQNQILNSFTQKDEVRVVNIKDIIHHPAIDDSSKCNNHDHHFPVMKIQRLAGNICYVMTNNAIWLTRLVITDCVSPLQPGETVTGLHANITPDPDDYNVDILDQVFNNCTPKPPQKYQIVNSLNSCTITEAETITVFQRFPLYQVLSDLTIKTIKHDKGKARESIIYNLEQPRPFSKEGPLISIHPFHLPSSWDPFISIMITTHAIIQILTQDFCSKNTKNLH